MVTAFVDLGSIVIVLVVMFALDAYAHYKENGTYAMMAGMLGIYTVGWIFNNGGVVQSTVYNANTATFVSNTVDPNLMAVVVIVCTLFSFMFIYFERGGVLG